MKALALLNKIQLMYLTDKDEIRNDKRISFQDIINLKSELLQVELEEGFSALTEAFESILDALNEELNHI